MSLSPVVHATFAIERTFAAAPNRVYRAWTDPDIKARWFIGPEGWTQLRRSLDLRVGGDEILHGRFESGTEAVFTARYHVVEPATRLIYVYDMHIDGGHLSVSLATVDFAPVAGATRMTFTEQAVYLDGKDGSASRRHGTGAHFDRLEALF